MVSSFVYGIGATVVLIIVGIVIAFWMLRYRDNLLGINFKKDLLDILKSNPIALSIWLAAWVVGVFMLAAAGAGRFV